VLLFLMLGQVLLVMGGGYVNVLEKTARAVGIEL
jgi:hypothetical protein